MKRILIISAIISVLIAFTACGSASGDSSEGTAQTTKAAASSAAESSEAVQEKSGQGSVLVAYFTPAENGENDAITSASLVNFDGRDMGNAAAVANMISSYTGAELFSIKTEKDYPLEYNDLADDAKAEQEAGELPKLSGEIDLSGYDTVFVVYPIWWYTMPQPIYSFFDEYDLSGKTIIPVTTHAGSGLADSVERIMELEPDATVKEGYAIAASDVKDAQSDIEGWLNEQGYQK